MTISATNMRYWWVNHKQTARQEISGGYLWAPLCEANGVRSQFYDNMRQAAPGDIVLSFANGIISQVGVVLDYASPAKKPEPFGTVGENWSDAGWILPVRWTPMAKPVRPKDMIATIGPLLPQKYSPIHPVSGNGNQKAYLAEIDKSVFDIIALSSGNEFALESLVRVADATNEVIDRVDDAAQAAIENSSSLEATIKRQLILARRGQGLFRSRAMKLGRTCRLTHLGNPSLLTASHIKPWRICDANERLDGANGLVLAPHVDRLFDRGYISFENDGRVLVSKRLAEIDLIHLGLLDACRSPGEIFDRSQIKYLGFHRDRVFLG